MKSADIQSFLPQKPQRLRTVEEPKRQQLVQATYDVVGCLPDVEYAELEKTVRAMARNAEIKPIGGRKYRKYSTK